jgi:hypothetical protein
MSKSDAWENDILLHVFQNASVANLGDAGGIRGSVTAGSLYVSLHTADPGEAGNQGTSETSYTGYARVAVARSSAGWTVAGTAPTKATNAALVAFGACTVGTPTMTYFGIGVSPTAGDTGELLYSGQLTAPLAVSPGITPQFAIGVLEVDED